jgi:Protein of unknown function (DUF3192)
MTSPIRSSGVALACVLALSGCVIAVGTEDWKDDVADWRDRQEHNRHVVETLQLGQSRDVLVADLGSADFAEAFTRDGRNFEVLFYRTRHVDDDGRTTKDETTPLVFVDGALVGWGESAVDKAAP